MFASVFPGSGNAGVPAAVPGEPVRPDGTLRGALETGRGLHI